MIRKRLPRSQKKGMCNRLAKTVHSTFGRKKREECFENYNEVLDELKQEFIDEYAKLYISAQCSSIMNKCNQAQPKLQAACVASGKNKDYCETVIYEHIKNHCKGDDKNSQFCDEFLKTTTTTTTTAKAETTTKGSSNGLLIGGIVGGVAIVIIAILIYLLCRKRSLSAKSPDPATTSDVKTKKIDKNSKATTTTAGTKTTKAPTNSTDQMI